jgi:hypothetical protein
MYGMLGSDVEPQDDAAQSLEEARMSDAAQRQEAEWRARAMAQQPVTVKKPSDLN